jgi:hypothetical protein
MCGNGGVNNYASPGALDVADDVAKVVRGGSWLWKHDSARMTRSDRDLLGYRSRSGVRCIYGIRS